MRREIADFSKKIADALRRVAPAEEGEQRRRAREAEDARRRHEEETQQRAQERRRLEADELGQKPQERVELRPATEPEYGGRDTLRPEFRREAPTAPVPTSGAKKVGLPLYVGLGAVGAVIGLLAARGIGSPYFPGIANATISNFLLSTLAGAVFGVWTAFLISRRNRQQ